MAKGASRSRPPDATGSVPRTAFRIGLYCPPRADSELSKTRSVERVQHDVVSLAGWLLESLTWVLTLLPVRELLSQSGELLSRQGRPIQQGSSALLRHGQEGRSAPH